jgi:hypothetical protein
MVMMVIMLQVPGYPDVRASATALPTLPSIVVPYPFFSFLLLHLYNSGSLILYCHPSHQHPNSVYVQGPSIRTRQHKMMPWLARDRKPSPLCCVLDHQHIAHIAR